MTHVAVHAGCAPLRSLLSDRSLVIGGLRVSPSRVVDPVQAVGVSLLRDCVDRTGVVMGGGN